MKRASKRVFRVLGFHYTRSSKEFILCTISQTTYILKRFKAHLYIHVSLGADENETKIVSC